MPIRRAGGPRRRDTRPKVCSFCVERIDYIDYKEVSRLVRGRRRDVGTTTPRSVGPQDPPAPRTRPLVEKCKVLPSNSWCMSVPQGFRVGAWRRCVQDANWQWPRVVAPTRLPLVASATLDCRSSVAAFTG